MLKEEEEYLDDEKSTPEVLKRFIEQYKGHIEEVSYYVEERNWGKKILETEFGSIQREHSTEWTIMSNIAAKLKDFIKEADGNLHKAFARNFINLLKGLLEGYIERANIYRSLNKWSEIEDPDYMDDQLKFQEELLKNIHNLRKVMGAINLDDAKGETKKIPIHGDKKVPFLMKDIIEEKFPSQFK